MTDEYGREHTDGSRSGGQPVDDSIKEKALALLNEARKERGKFPLASIHPLSCDEHGALCRAVEQHEATKQEHEKFKWEVSFAVLSAMKVLLEMAEHDCEVRVRPILERFIIPKPKPDPLVEVMEDLGWYNAPTDAEDLRAALDALGFEIREKNDE